MITYRLADSLPSNLLRALEEELRSLSSKEQDVQRRGRIEILLDAGHGSCILRQKEAAEVIIETWRWFAQKRYDLIAWVVMPNHVHILIRVYDGVPLGKIVQSWKSFTGRRIGEFAQCNAGRSQGGVWARDYWDRFIRDEMHFQASVNYIFHNPVKAGLVLKEGDRPWSNVLEWPRELEGG